MIFGLRSTQLGRGIVGGPLLSMEDLSQHTANVALRLLGGEPPRNISTPIQRLAAPVFDSRELRRWHIDEARLPPGSTIQFREPTAWQRYRRPLVAIAAIMSGQLILVVGLVTNLGRRRSAERRRGESEGRYRLISSAAPVMLWLAGRDKLRTDSNGSWLDFTGRPIEAALGNGWTDTLHPDDLARVLETYRQAVDRREPFRMECRLRRYDGEYRWMLETGMPRFLENGTFAGYVGSAIDVTDLTLARCALSSLSRRLMETDDRERAAVVKKLQDDLCQRMMGLTIRLHSLSQTSPGGDEGQMRRDIEELSSQFGEVASEIFTISDQLYSSKLKLLGLVTASRDVCRELCARHDVMIDFEDQGIPVKLSNDIALVLFRVMLEALHNAAKHAAVRRVAVSLRGHPGEICLEVADEGVGFNPEVVKNTHGLGLIAIRERLSLVDGELTVESRPGAGTRIRARVPLRPCITDSWAEPPVPAMTIPERPAV